MSKKSVIVILLVGSVALLMLFIGLAIKYGSPTAGFGKSADSSFTGTTSKFFSNAEVGILDLDGILINAGDYLRKIRMLKKRATVKAVVLRVNSPGGAVAPAQELYRELKRLDALKPVIASFSSVAASGGYYVACGARTIFSNPGTLTGSIGVIMNLANLEELYKWIKISPIVIKSGKYKDLGSSHRKMTAEEVKILTQMADDIHNQFKSDVSEARKIPMDILENIADGRVYTGRQAFELGLVDSIGTFEDAVVFAAQSAGIPENSPLYYPRVKNENILDLLSNVQSGIKKIFFSGAESYPLAM